jgi:hypothetical protein
MMIGIIKLLIEYNKLFALYICPNPIYGSILITKSYILGYK